MPLIYEKPSNYNELFDIALMKIDAEPFAMTTLEIDAPPPNDAIFLTSGRPPRSSQTEPTVPPTGEAGTSSGCR